MQLTGDGQIIGLQAGGLPDSSVLPGDLAQKMTHATAVVAASQTAIDFLSIPSWVKRLTFTGAGLSTNDNSNYQVRLGTSSGIVSSGYLSVTTATNNGGFGGDAFTTGFSLTNNGGVGASGLMHGSLIFTKLSGNLWVVSGTFCNSVAGTGYSISGSIDLGGTLDRLRLTCANGVAIIDAGSCNILYEG